MLQEHVRCQLRGVEDFHADSDTPLLDVLLAVESDHVERLRHGANIIKHPAHKVLHQVLDMSDDLTLGGRNQPCDIKWLS